MYYLFLSITSLQLYDIFKPKYFHFTMMVVVNSRTWPSILLHKGLKFNVPAIHSTKSAYGLWKNNVIDKLQKLPEHYYLKHPYHLKFCYSYICMLLILATVFPLKMILIVPRMSFFFSVHLIIENYRCLIVQVIYDLGRKSLTSFNKDPHHAYILVFG